MPRLRVPGEPRDKPKTLQGIRLIPQQKWSPTSRYFTSQEIKAFTAAVDRRVGRASWNDWRVILRLYRKGSDIALKESGQHSRQNPIYKRRFHEIIAALPPISSSEATAKQYRAALLEISHLGEKFEIWYEETKPRLSNPKDLLDAYRDTTDPKQSSSNQQPNQHAVELARAQEDGAAKITELTKELNFLKGDNIDAVLQRTANWPQSRVHALIVSLATGWSRGQVDRLISDLQPPATNQRTKL